jgi:hypothetical protein
MPPPRSPPGEGDSEALRPLDNRTQDLVVWETVAGVRSVGARLARQRFLLLAKTVELLV